MKVALTPSPAPILKTVASTPAALEAEPQDVFLASGESLGMSDFALGRHKPGTGYSYFQGSHSELLHLVQQNWEQRVPGAGRNNLEEVVIVPMPSARFMTTTVAVDDETSLNATNFRRREHEDPYVRVTAEGEARPANFAQVVLYSKETLGKNDERSRRADWEVVSIIASPVANEPMDPVTMMRNMRGKAGGSQVNYTAEQLLDSIDFWSRHVKVSG